MALRPPEYEAVVRTALVVGEAPPAYEEVDPNAAAHSREHTLSLSQRNSSTINSQGSPPTEPGQRLLGRDLQLLQACQSGSLAKVQALLNAGADQRVTDEDGYAPIHHAVLRGSRKIAVALSKAPNWNVNLPGKNKFTALHLAVDRAQMPLVKFLSSRPDIDINQLTLAKWTALNIAARKGHDKAMEILLKRRGIDPNVPDMNGWTPLNAAARGGHLDCVRLLLERGDTDVDRPDNKGWSPLHSAIMRKHSPMAQLILDSKKADLNSRDNEGMIPVHRAALSGNGESLMLLLATDGVEVLAKTADGRTLPQLAAEGRDQSCIDQVEAITKKVERQSRQQKIQQLIRAAKGGALEELRELIRDGAEQKVRDPHGNAPIHWAARNGRKEILVELKKHKGWSINSRNCKGETPLNIAASYGNLNEVKYLAKLTGIKLDQTDNKGRSPLFNAAFNGHAQVLKHFLNKTQADAKKPDADGLTPLHAAVESNYIDCAVLLITSGKVDVNAKTQWGFTPLMSAAHFGFPQGMRALLDCDEIDLSVISEKRETLQQLAEKKGNAECVALVKAALDKDRAAKRVESWRRRRVREVERKIYVCESTCGQKVYRIEGTNEFCYGSGEVIRLIGGKRLSKQELQQERETLEKRKAEREARLERETLEKRKAERELQQERETLEKRKAEREARLERETLEKRKAEREARLEREILEKRKAEREARLEREILEKRKAEREARLEREKRIERERRERVKDYEKKVRVSDAWAGTAIYRFEGTDEFTDSFGNQVALECGYRKPSGWQLYQERQELDQRIRKLKEQERLTRYEYLRESWERQHKPSMYLRMVRDDVQKKDVHCFQSGNRVAVFDPSTGKGRYLPSVKPSDVAACVLQ